MRRKYWCARLSVSIESIATIHDVGISLVHPMHKGLDSGSSEYIIAIYEEEIFCLDFRDEMQARTTNSLVLLITNDTHMSATFRMTCYDLTKHLDTSVRSTVVTEYILYIGVCLRKERFSTLRYVFLHAIDGNDDGYAHSGMCLNLELRKRITFAMNRSKGKMLWKCDSTMKSSSMALLMREKRW